MFVDSSDVATGGTYVPLMTRRLPALIAALALSVPVVAITATTAEAAAPKKYSSCDQLHRDFAHGVSRSKAAALRQVRDGYGTPAYSKKAVAVYGKNKSNLDRDDDGTACES